MKTTKKISLISVLIILLGCVNIARADVCFLPDGASCAKGDTEGFWPCVGDDCPSPDGKCDASYNSRMSTNECGAACTRCTDSSSPYNGLYKCPENTCNCNEYTSTEAFNECNQSCKVCRISGDKNYGKYKCPAVPEWGCNPQCEDYTLTAEDQCKDCDQCTNKNAPAEKQGLWKCTDCDQDIYNQPIARLTSAEIANHCYENETCGCYMKCDSCFGKDLTMQDCINAGYDSAKNECNGKRGTVYETCCNTCNGYIYSTDLSKTSDGWSCTECPNSCDGGSKFSCGCKTGYHSNGNEGCAKDCAVVTCNAVTIPANAHGTTTCQSIKSDCSNNGSPVYIAWECNSEYHKNSAGNGCEKDCTPTRPASCKVYNPGTCTTRESANITDGCGGVLKCYESACSSGQTCDGYGHCTGTPTPSSQTCETAKVTCALNLAGTNGVCKWSFGSGFDHVTVGNTTGYRSELVSGWMAKTALFNSSSFCQFYTSNNNLYCNTQLKSTSQTDGLGPQGGGYFSCECEYCH